MPEISRIPPHNKFSFLNATARGAVGAGRGAHLLGKGVHEVAQKTKPFVNTMASGFNRMAGAKAFGIGGALTMVDMAVTGFMTDATYDPTVHDNRINEFGKTMLAEMGTELPIGLMATALGGGPAGIAVALGTTALSMAGLGPGHFLKTKMDTMGREFDNERYGKGPIQQNQQTLRATSQNMQLLGQAGFGGNEVINPQSFAARQRGLLGSEAMLMHN